MAFFDSDNTDPTRQTTPQVYIHRLTENSVVTVNASLRDMRDSLQTYGTTGTSSASTSTSTSTSTARGNRTGNVNVNERYHAQSVSQLITSANQVFQYKVWRDQSTANALSKYTYWAASIYGYQIDVTEGERQGVVTLAETSLKEAQGYDGQADELGVVIDKVVYTKG
jgi:hypothetical protein